MEENKKNIVWLASYPKSGNTWMRIFLANYLSRMPEPVDINQLNDFPIASSRSIFEEATGISSSDLLDKEIDRLRPEVFQYFSTNAENELFFKIHDKYYSNKKAIIPIRNTKAVIYIVRNPLDVAVSFARHMNVDINIAIERMNEPNFSFCNKTENLALQLRQKLQTWSAHIESWIEQKDVPVKIIRYEDMLSNTERTFMDCIKFISIPFVKEDFDKAIKHSEFKNLKEQEQKFGFREKPYKQDSFFREGKSGNWKKHLSKEQVLSIIINHKKMMKRFSYLDQNDIPL